ncbi:MAG: hypothetical protein K9L75_00635 [Spirochaetia bacterium]|nr:hypothetical protein [Spirochaetia bacterium]
MTEERMRVLQMIADGKISAEEGAQLLESMGEEAADSRNSHTELSSYNGAEGQEKGGLSGIKGKKLRIQVRSRETGKVKVNLKIPLRLARIAEKFVPKEAKKEMEEQGINISQIVDSLDELEDATLVDVSDEDSGEDIRIYIE